MDAVCVLQGLPRERVRCARGSAGGEEAPGVRKTRADVDRGPPPPPPPDDWRCSAASSGLRTRPTSPSRASPAYGHQPFRCGPPHHPRQAAWGSPGSRARRFRTCHGSSTARGRSRTRACALDACRLPPRITASALRSAWFRDSIPRPCVPLSTLHRHPCRHRRMTRGRRGSLLLRREALLSSPSCRFIPAHYPFGEHRRTTCPRYTASPGNRSRTSSPARYQASTRLTANVWRSECRLAPRLPAGSRKPRHRTNATKVRATTW